MEKYFLKRLVVKKKMLVFKDGDNKEIPVPEEKRGKPCLSDEQIEELAELGKKIKIIMAFQ
jgi:phosphoenolpyruvate synthase/pyruvate phosphate dikinase